MGAPKDFPWKPRSLEELIGKSLLRGAEDDDDEAATEKVDSSCLDGKVLGIYFSAHWCPPCRGFTPVLIEKYNALKKAGKNIEIIFASSDRDNASFVEYFAEMPWLALPYENRSEKEGLSEMFEVGGIPTLVFLDENRKIITKNGRGGISSSTFIEDFPYYPKPLNDLSNDMDGIDENPSLLVLMEKAEKSEQDTVEKAFQPVAEKEFKTKEKRVYCFTAKGGGPIEQIRQMCKLQDATKKPVMVILDIQKQSFHLPCAGSEDVTEPNLAKFIEDFRAKKTLGVSF
jgi:nucleoredoxin